MRRNYVIGSLLALALSAPAMAQETSSAAEEQRFRDQMRRFEVLLREAVRQGADAFARQYAQDLPPGVQLTASDPQVRGFAPPLGGGLLFTVAVPGIRPIITSLLFADEPLPAPRLQPARAGGGNRVTGASTPAPPDPVSASPVIDDGRCATRMKAKPTANERDYEYSVSVCDALMDAMLDNFGSLPIKDGDWLTVAANDGAPSPSNYLNTSSGLTTYLQIKGSDLLAYRQAKISKEEARKLVDIRQR